MKKQNAKKRKIENKILQELKKANIEEKKQEIDALSKKLKELQINLSAMSA